MAFSLAGAYTAIKTGRAKPSPPIGIGIAPHSASNNKFKGNKMKIEIKKYERFIPWAWGGIFILILVLFVKNALAH